MPNIDDGAAGPETRKVDMLRLIADQRRERYRTVVVHGPPLSGKSEFARRLADAVPSAHYLDLLAHFAAAPDLAGRVDVFDAAALRGLTLAYANDHAAACLVVDDLDFLVYAWNGNLTEFQAVVGKLSAAQSPAVIVFVLQTQPALEGWELLNSAHTPRVLRLEEIAPLPSPSPKCKGA